MSTPKVEVKVLIAGPGDVEKERGLAVAAIEKWNRLHSDRMGIRLVPMHWKHARPGLGDDAQALINRQVVAECAVGIAFFSARLGTETPRADSGTVEEIELLANSSKDVMVYFFEGKANLKEIKPEQLEKVNTLRKSLQSKGLLGSYRSIRDLEGQLDLHVARLGYELADQMQVPSKTLSIQAREGNSEVAEAATSSSMVASLKTFLSNNQPIRTHDLVMDEVERIRGHLLGDLRFAPRADITPEEIENLLPELETLSEGIMAVFAVGCRWASSDNAEPWIPALIRLCDLPSYADPRSVVPGHKTHLYRYPALLALYAGGIAALAGDRYDMFAKLLTGGSISDYYGHKVPIVLGLNSYHVIENSVEKLLPSWKQQWLPFSRHLWLSQQLRSSVEAFVAAPEVFTAVFDRFEYLLGVVYWAQFRERFESSWAPAGTFVWREHNRDWDPNRMSVVKQIWSEVQKSGTDWPLLKTGLFGGSPDKFLEVAQAYNGSLWTRPKQ